MVGVGDEVLLRQHEVSRRRVRGQGEVAMHALRAVPAQKLPEKRRGYVNTIFTL